MQKSLYQFNGKLLEVSIEEYKEFYREFERGKYCKKIEKDAKIVSVERIMNENELFREKDIFADINIDIEFTVEKKDEAERLRKALLQLNCEEYELIKALFYEKKSLRQYAKKIGKSYGTVLYKEKQILKKLKKLLNC